MEGSFPSHGTGFSGSAVVVRFTRLLGVLPTVVEHVQKDVRLETVGSTYCPGYRRYHLFDYCYVQLVAMPSLAHDGGLCLSIPTCRLSKRYTAACCTVISA